MRIDKDGNATVNLAMKIKLNVADWARANGCEIDEVPEDLMRFLEGIFADSTLDGIPAGVEFKLNRN